MDETARLPLPAKTAFRFRTTERSATYYTRLSEQGVLKHFRDLSEKEMEKTSTAGEVQLLIVYSDIRFEITITAEEKGCLFRVTTLRGP